MQRPLLRQHALAPLLTALTAPSPCPAASSAPTAGAPRFLLLLPSPSQSYQTDWEAILESSPEAFLQAVSPWMYPPEVRQAQQAQQAQQQEGQHEGVQPVRDGEQQAQGQQPAETDAGQTARQAQQPAQQQQDAQQPAQPEREADGGSGGASDGQTSAAAAAEPAACKPVDQLPKVQRLGRALCAMRCLMGVSMAAFRHALPSCVAFGAGPGHAAPKLWLARCSWCAPNEQPGSRHCALQPGTQAPLDSRPCAGPSTCCHMLPHAATAGD